MAYTPPAPLWDQVRSLERQQLVQWKMEFYRNKDLELIVQEQVFAIETTVKRFRGGNVSVTVVILDKLSANCATGYFRLQKVLNGDYEVVSGTFTDA
jgi:hypothetical protein